MSRGERVGLWLSAAAVGWAVWSPLAGAGPAGPQVLRRGLLDESWTDLAGWSGAWRPLGDLVDGALLLGGFGAWTAAVFLAGGWLAVLAAAWAPEPGAGRGKRWLAGLALALCFPWAWAIGAGTALADLLALGAALSAARRAGTRSGLLWTALALSFGELGLLAPVLVQLSGGERRSTGAGLIRLGWVLAAAWIAVRSLVVPDPWGFGGADLATTLTLDGGRAVALAAASAAVLAAVRVLRGPRVPGAALLAALAIAGVCLLTGGGSVIPMACGLAAWAACVLARASSGPVGVGVAVLAIAASAAASWRESSALAADHELQTAYAVRAAAATQRLPGALPVLDSTWPPARLRALGTPSGLAALARRQGAAREVWPLRTDGEERPYVRQPLEFGIDPDGGRRVVPVAALGSATPERLRLEESSLVELVGSFAGRRLDALLWTSEGYAAARGPEWEAMGTAPGPGGVDLPRFGIGSGGLLELEGGRLRRVLERARRAGSRRGYLELRWVDDARGIANRPVAASEWIELSWGAAAGPTPEPERP